MERKHEDYFTKKIFRKQFVPAIISACGLAFGDMMDGIVVGQRMGVTGLAAISLALPSFMVMNVLMHGLGLGGAIRFSGLMAKGKKEEGIRGFQGILSAALMISALLSIGANLFMTPLLALLETTEADGALFAVSRTYLQIILSGMPLFFTAYIMNYFLRNDDSEKLAGFGFTVGNLSDIVLNVVFVLLLDGGAAGAAWATLAGQLISICVYLPGFSGKTHSLRLLPFCPDPKGSLSCFKAGFASSSQYLFSMVFLLCANRVLLRSMGSVGGAVFDVVQNVSFLIIYLYDGAVKAAQPLLSTYCGEHNRPGRRCTMRLALSRGLTAGGMVALLTACFPQSICLVFGITDSKALKTGAYALRVYCVSALLAGVCILLEGCYQACGEEKKAYLITILRGAAVLLPVTLLFSAWGGRFFWWLYPVTEALTLLIFAGYCRYTAGRQEESEEGRVYTATIHNKYEELSSLLSEIESFCKRWEAAAKQIYFVTMTVEELCAAIMQNGFGETDGYIQITLVAEAGGAFSLHIRDNAVSFNPFSLYTSRLGGDGKVNPDALGILVIREKAEEFFYRRYLGFNTLVVRI